MQFQTCKVKRTGDLLHNSVSTLTVNELCTFKMVKMVNFMHFLLPPEKQIRRWTDRELQKEQAGLMYERLS